MLVLHFLPGYWKRIVKSLLNQKHKNTSVQDTSKNSPNLSLLKNLFVLCAFEVISGYLIHPAQIFVSIIFAHSIMKTSL